MKIKIGSIVSFDCPYAIKEGKVIKINNDSYEIQSDISKWTIKKEKIITIITE